MGAMAPDDLVAAFHDRTLPKREWTHEAHLIVCWSALRTMSAADAVPHLRRSIRAYNEVVGTPNTDSSGYHETLTRYYVEAVDWLHADHIGAVLASSVCGRTAPLEYWSRDVLFGAAARLGWVEPDLAPLPWREAEVLQDRRPGP